MSVDWTLACIGCRHWAWLGSMKPWKWDGFQIGNRFVAELFSAHASAGCSLLVTSDHSALDPPWEHGEHGDAVDGWLEDIRSRWFFADSCRHDTTPPEMVCATCKTPLDLPSTADGEELREAGYRPAVGAFPLIVGQYLWFCGPNCRDRFHVIPGRTWRECQNLRAGLRIRVRCLRCGVETSLGALDPEQSDAIAFAEWLMEHVYYPPTDSDLAAATACRLKAYIDSPS